MLNELRIPWKKNSYIQNTSQTLFPPENQSAFCKCLSYSGDTQIISWLDLQWLSPLLRSSVMSLPRVLRNCMPASQPAQSPSSLCFRKPSVMDRKSSFVTLREVKCRERSALQRGREEPRQLPQETPQPGLQERESTGFANSKGKWQFWRNDLMFTVNKKVIFITTGQTPPLKFSFC